MGTVFLVEGCSFTFDEHKVFITNLYFASNNNNNVTFGDILVELLSTSPFCSAQMCLSSFSIFTRVFSAGSK